MKIHLKKSDVENLIFERFKKIYESKHAKNMHSTHYISSTQYITSIKRKKQKHV